MWIYGEYAQRRGRKDEIRGYNGGKHDERGRNVEEQNVNMNVNVRYAKNVERMMEIDGDVLDDDRTRHLLYQPGSNRQGESSNGGGRERCAVTGP